jgi:hypothetical protein
MTTLNLRGNMNNTKFLLPNLWHNYFISCKNKLLDNNLIKEMLNKFWDEIMNNIDDKMVILLFRIQYEDKSFRTIGNLQKIDKSQFTRLYRLLSDLLSILSNDYKSLPIINIVFSYKIIDTENKVSKIDSNNIKDDKLPTFKFYGYNLPLTMDIKKWGTILSHDNNHYLIKREKSDLLYNILIEDLWNKIEIKDSKNMTILTFKDVKDINSQDKSTFTRIINNQKYYFKNGELILKTLEKTTNVLTSLKLDKKVNNKFITLDIETQTINNIMTPYCISFFDGKISKSFYLSDYKDSQEMLTFAISSLLKRKYNGYKVYVHNLSNFDGIFILKILSSINHIKVHPILKDGKMINIKLSYDNINAYQISFRDSYLILPSSLRKLAIQFNVNNKGLFPYNFVNDKFNNNINLNYIGKVPAFKYFNDITLDQYNQLFYKSWSLKDETIKYCQQDCISLYQIIHNFNNLIFEKYHLNIHKFPTLPSLSFGIYRTHYLKDYPIPLISGQLFNDISKSFTGGSTDMFKPYGENIRCYDVNSLYPYIMKSNKFPVGTIRKFIGDITILNNNDYYWFGDCDISTKKDLYQPYLQLHNNTKHGMRTISPNGSFNMILNSCEYFNALKDYNIKINHGYFFNSDNIFYDFVNDLYNLRMKYPKTDPMNMTCKLIMNSLYGRFAMKPIFTDQVFVNKNQLNKLIEKYEIIELIDLNDDNFFCSFINPKNFDKDLKISIGIASAVTAYSRVYISKFKNNPDYNLYYTDTDSIFIDSDLDNKFLNNDIGNFKLEYIFKEAVFLGPKIYAGITFDNKYISKIKGYTKPK